MRITNVRGRQIVDCKCRPLVEVQIETDDGRIYRGSAPTGQSVGIHESVVLRDGDPNDYKGLSVHKAVGLVDSVIAPALVGEELDDWKRLDAILRDADPTTRKEKLGGNTVYSASIAAARAVAGSQGKQFYQLLAGGPISTIPCPSFNMVNGGTYDGYSQSFNEFIVMPYAAQSIEDAVQKSILLFEEVGNVVSDYVGGPTRVAPSYGYVAPSDDPEVVFDLIQKAIDNLGYTDVFAFSMDCASSEFYDRDAKTYLLKGKQVDSHELVDYVEGLTRKFPFVFIEDLLDEDDWEGFAYAHSTLKRTLVVGDDLIVTNRERLERAVKEDCVDGFILKPNQIGTLSEALETYEYAASHGLFAIPSGRSGGVIDDIVMDLSVGLQVPFQKNGAPRSGERIEKLNFLMRAADSDPDVHLADIASMVRF